MTKQLSLSEIQNRLQAMTSNLATSPRIEPVVTSSLTARTSTITTTTTTTATTTTTTTTATPTVVSSTPKLFVEKFRILDKFLIINYFSIDQHELLHYILVQPIMIQSYHLMLMKLSPSVSFEINTY